MAALRLTWIEFTQTKPLSTAVEEGWRLGLQAGCEKSSQSGGLAAGIYVHAICQSAHFVNR